MRGRVYNAGSFRSWGAGCRLRSINKLCVEFLERNQESPWRGRKPVRFVAVGEEATVNAKWTTLHLKSENACGGGHLHKSGRFHGASPEAIYQRRKRTRT